MHPTVDAVQWREETERVAARLSAAAQKQGLGGLGRGQGLGLGVGGDWVAHVAMLRNYVRGTGPGATSSSSSSSSKQQQQQQQPPQMSSSSSEKVSPTSNPSDASYDLQLAEQLKSIALDLTGHLQALSRAESVLSGRDNMKAFSNDYAVHKQALDKFQMTSTATSLRIDELNNTDADLNEKLEEMRESLDNKMGGEGSSAGDGANNSILRMKEGIKQLKLDIATMNARTGVVSATLMTQRSMVKTEMIQKQRIKREKLAKIVHQKSAVNAMVDGSRRKLTNEFNEDDDDYLSA